MVKMGNVWDRTAEFLSDNLVTVLPIALFAIFVPASISGNFQSIENPSATLRLVFSLVSLLFALLSLWGQLAIIALAIDPTLDHGAGRIATRRLPLALLVWIVLGAAFMLLCLPIPIVLAMNGFDLVAASQGTAIDLPPEAAMPVGLYSIALGVFLLWAVARLALVTPLVVGEGRALGAIRRSFALTRGAVFRIIGVILLYALITVVSMMAAKTVFGSIFQLVMGGSDGLTLAGVLTSVVVAAVETAFTVLAAAFTAKLYRALAARSEGTAFA